MNCPEVQAMQMTTKADARRKHLEELQKKAKRYIGLGVLAAFAASIDRLWNGIADAAKPYMWSDPVTYMIDITIGLVLVVSMAAVWAYVLERQTGIRLG
jgi:hypothetical protein